MKVRIFAMLLALCLAASLAACGNEQAVSDTVSVTETVEMTETTGAPTEIAVTEERIQPEVVVGFLPTEAGAWQYVAIADQKAAVEAMEKAVSAIYSDEWWIKGDRTAGLMVVGNGEIWDFVESGELVYALGRVKAEDAADLYALCEAAAREMGWKEPVKPEQLTGIQSATLRISGKELLLTEKASLNRLGEILSAGEYELGGTGCPFTALLNVTLESGETLTVALATDSCSVWMSEGYYYSFGSSNDSQDLYDLIGITLEFGEIVE